MMDWISIEDRPPDIGQTCLFTNGEVIRVGYITEDPKIMTLAGLDPLEEEYTYDFISRATHWMQLPNPPKEEE